MSRQKYGLSLLVAATALGLPFTTSSASGQSPLKVGEHFKINISSSGQSDVEGVTTPKGRIFEIHHPDATYIAVHFSEFDLARGDRLIVSDLGGGQSYTLKDKGKMNAGTFWSQHIKGDTAVLELITTGRKLGKGFVIDEYAAGFVDLGGSFIEAICGVDDKENAICYESSDPDEYQHARAAARLFINGSGLCTGWLASINDHLITNEHCITSASDALNTDYEFMAEAPTCGSTNCQLCFPGTVFSGATFIQDDAGLDYALVQINSGSPAATYGYMEIDNRTAVPGEQIYIPQYPGGRAKELGIYSTYSGDTGGVCRVDSITAPPCSGSGYNDVGYFCDTEGGSSGSPVLATSNHKVIALHHCADCPNRGVPITLVYAEISDIIISSGLKVTPGTGLDSEGDPGGPFTPSSEVYTLENLSETPIDYSVTNSAAWVSLSDTGGTLPGGGTTTVTVSVNSSADSLPANIYTDTVSFINTTDHVGDTTRSVTLAVGFGVVYQWTMDTDPGWSTEGLWAFGQPTGDGGLYGGPDPTGGYTGSNVYGYNLAGDYENSLPETHLTSGPIDCTGMSNTTLKFQRWLGVEQPAYDHAYIRVSNNGSTWTTVWENTSEITDTAWSLQSYDISALADDQSTVYLRWTMGTTDGSWQYCGWNIDDIQIFAFGGGCTSHAECDDGLYCNGSETCVDESCQPGIPVTCDDGVACTDDSCNEGTDSCDYVPNDASCDNDVYCDGVETCDEVAGCLPGTAIDCDDTVACTADSCNETTDSCDNIPDDGVCDDDVFCNGAETCDSVSGCLTGSDPCPGQLCDEGGAACVDCFVDGDCEDFLFCTGVETCVGGACQAGSDPCPGQGCDEDNDVCVPVTCNNNTVCEAGEDCDNCPNDCISGGGGSGCGNGVCEPSIGEDCLSCASDCNGKQVGAEKKQFCCGDGAGVNAVGCDDARCTTEGWACSDAPTDPYCCGDTFCTGAEDSCNCAVDCGLPPVEVCDNGADDDCDGLVDCLDVDDCTGDPACACGPTGTPCTSNTDCCTSCDKKTGLCR